jgi:hypothetical protein
MYNKLFVLLVYSFGIKISLCRTTNVMISLQDTYEVWEYYTQSDHFPACTRNGGRTLGRTCVISRVSGRVRVGECS